jgi:hypothetical protein
MFLVVNPQPWRRALRLERGLSRAADPLPEISPIMHNGGPRERNYYTQLLDTDVRFYKKNLQYVHDFVGRRLRLQYHGVQIACIVILLLDSK